MRRTILLAALAALTAPVLAVAQTGPVLIGPSPFLVEGGPGTQTEPHVSGSTVSFTNQSSTTSEIRYKDVATTAPSTGIDNTTPSGGNYRDSISDVSGSTIVFKRAGDISSTESIMFFDSANPAGGAHELAPAPGTQRQSAAIGGTTVAFEQKTASTLIRNICVASTTSPSSPAACLTTSDAMNRDPAVSPDGNTVVWAKCTGLLSGCDIWAASKNGAGGWNAPRAITTGGGNDVFPDTNGTVVTWASNLDGDSDIYFANLDGTGVTNRLVIADAVGAQEENPNISGSRIAFQRRAASGQPADIYIYDMVGQALFLLADTPTMDEKLNDISTTASGQSWVVWAAVDPVTGSDDVWAATFTISAPAPCEEDDVEDPAAVCANPGNRPLLMDATVTRSTGMPNGITRTFAADDDESAVMCITNNRATAGWVQLNGHVEVGPCAFKQQVTSIARAVELEDSNTVRMVIAGQKDTSYRVRIYGAANSCNDDDDQEEEIRSITMGLTAPVTVDGKVDNTLRTLRGVRVTVLENGILVAEADELLPNAAMGCSTAGGSALLVGVLLAAALWFMGRKARQPAPVRARNHGKR